MSVAVKLDCAHLESVTTDTDLIQPLHDETIAFKGKLDFADAEIMNWSGPGGDSAFAVDDGAYQVDKPLDMNAHGIVIGEDGSGNVLSINLSSDGRDIEFYNAGIRTSSVETNVIQFTNPSGHDAQLSLVANDSWRYPHNMTKNADGPIAHQTKFSVVAKKDKWAFSETQGTAPPQKDPLGRNAAFEVCAAQHYWTDKDLDTVGCYSYPIFEVCANPHIVTGKNNLLAREDVCGITGATRFSERPSCVTINKPKLFWGTNGQSTGQPSTGANFAEPDALVVRFGYTDMEEEYGDGFDPDTYQPGTSHLVASERGISFRVPVVDSNLNVD